MSKKEKILEAALKLLVKNGIHATPMSAIAKAANTGMGTIYNYFENKQVLINAIYVYIKKEEEKLFLNATKNKHVKSQFEAYYRIVTTFFLENPIYFHFLEQLNSSPLITNESREVGLEAIKPVIQLLEIGQNSGMIKHVPIDELLQFIGGAVLAHLRYAMIKGIDHPVDNQLRLLWDAIKE